MKGGGSLNIRDIIQKSDLSEPYDRLFDFLDLGDIIRVEQAYGGRQINFRRGCEDAKTEYPDLFLALGTDKAMKVIKTFGDMRIYFPTLRQSALDKIKRHIIAEFDGYNHLTLARKYGYTERHIRRIVAQRGIKRPLIDENQLTLSDIYAEINC